MNYFGYAIEPLNMKNERNEGSVTEDGNYIFDRKTDAGDAWLGKYF